MAITRSTSTGWLQDLDAVAVNRATSDGWVETTTAAVASAPGASTVTATTSAPSVVLTSSTVIPDAASVTVSANAPAANIAYIASPGSGSVSAVGEAPVAAVSSRWRLRFYGDNGYAYVQVTEVEMRASIGGADQCSGGTVSSSSDYSASYQKAYAFDNNGTTRWMPATAGGAIAWLEYKFVGKTSVAQYAIDALSANNNPSEAPRQWWLEEDVGGVWTIRDYRYDQGSWGATELRAFTLGAVDFNRCIDGTATASSESSIYNVAAAAFSGSTNDYPWLSATTGTADPIDEWLEYDFGTGVAHNIQKYHVQIRQDVALGLGQEPTAWTLEYYNGATWQVADTQSGISWSTQGETQEFIVASPTSAQRWRIHITAHTGGDLVGLTRLRLFTHDSTATYAYVGAGSLSITGAQPAMLAPPGAASITASGEVPSVNVTQLAPVGDSALAIFGQLPTVLASKSAAPGTVTAALETYAPIPSVAVFLPVGSCALSIGAQAPNATQNSPINPGAAVGAISGASPELVRLFSCAPGVATAAISGAAPSTLESISSIALPAPASASVAGAAPDAAIGIVPTPPSLESSISGHAPGLLVYRVAAAGSATVLASGFAPGVSFGAIASPQAGVLSVSGASPTPLASVSIEVPSASVSVVGAAWSPWQQHIPSPGSASVSVAGSAPLAVTGGSTAPGEASVSISGSAPAAAVDTWMVITGNAPDISSSSAWSLGAQPRVSPSLSAIPNVRPATGMSSISAVMPSRLLARTVVRPAIGGGQKIYSAYTVARITAK